MAIIQAIDVTKSFGKSAMHVNAVRGINLKIEAGELVAIVGPSGSGKSSLMSLLGAISAPTSGQILVGGVDIATLNDRQRTLLRRQRIGFIFQAFNLVPTLTAIENVSLPLELDGVSGSKARQRAEVALEEVGLAHRKFHLPSTMSGGEQQRVAIARALVIRPALVLADEPTGNLDSSSSDQIVRMLRELVDEKHQTVIMVTHDNDVAKQADRIIHVRDGRIEQDERQSAKHLALIRRKVG